MDAQNHGAISAGNVNTSGYGALSSNQAVVNGVLPRGQHVGDGSGQVDQERDNPNLQDLSQPESVQPPEGTTHSGNQQGPSDLHPPYEQGEMVNAGMPVQTQTPTPSVPVERVERSVPSPVEPAVQTHEFFSAESRTTSSPVQQNVRWFSRVTEFLRTTASRSVNGVDRMLDNLGFQHVHVTSSFAGQQGGHEFARASMQAQTSPPPMAPPVPLSWSGPERREQSLFTREQLERLRQARRDHPLLYGQPSEEGSENSSRLQAEVQRQMEEYALRYQSQVRDLQQEVMQLRRERSEWSQQRVSGQPQGNLPVSPPGNLPVHRNRISE